MEGGGGGPASVITNRGGDAKGESRNSGEAFGRAVTKALEKIGAVVMGNKSSRERRGQHQALDTDAPRRGTASKDARRCTASEPI